MTVQFVHAGKNFEIRQLNDTKGVVIKVFDLGNGKQVGPIYTVTNEIISDYKVDTGKDMIEELMDIAESDIRSLYIR